MAGSAKAPVHLWIVGILATLWNGFGSLDFTMSAIGNEAWMAQMTAGQRAWLEAAPAWIWASWACGVLGGLAGSLLLLARSRHAVGAFTLSLAGLAANTLSQLALPEPSPHLDSSGALILHLAIWGIAIALLVYALRLRSRGVLR
jgi:hypothetical protein